MSATVKQQCLAGSCACRCKNAGTQLGPSLHPTCRIRSYLEGLQRQKLPKRQRMSSSIRRTAALEEQQVLVDEEAEEMTEEEYKFLLDQPSPHPDVQQTLKRSFTISGIGLHSDEEACVRVRPALAGEGRYFIRVGEGTIPKPALEEDEVTDGAKILGEPHEGQGEAHQSQVEAMSTLDNIEEVEKIHQRKEHEDVILATLQNAMAYPEDCLFTTLREGEQRVYATEALLSALEACGVDNSRIEIEGGGEIPACDGSAAQWVDCIKAAGLRVAPALSGAASAPKHRLAPHKVITVREGESFISLLPSTSTLVTYGVDHLAEAPIIGVQWHSWSPFHAEKDHYRWTVAPARPYLATPQEIFNRRAQGYFKAGDESLCIIADWDQWYVPDNIRYFDDEPARRRLQEFVGALALLSEGGNGGLPQGHIVAFQASRDLQLRFLEAVKKVCRE